MPPKSTTTCPGCKRPVAEGERSWSNHTRSCVLYKTYASRTRKRKDVETQRMSESIPQGPEPGPSTSATTLDYAPMDIDELDLPWAGAQHAAGPSSAPVSTIGEAVNTRPPSTALSVSPSSAPMHPVPLLAYPQEERPGFTTKPDRFGLFRVYPGGRPSFTPDDMKSSVGITDSTTFTNSSTAIWAANKPQSKPEPSSQLLPEIFPNKSVHLLLDWFYDGTTGTGKSLQQLNSLVKKVIVHPDFRPEDLTNFRAEKEVARLDEILHGPESIIRVPDPWKRETVMVPMCPPTGQKYASMEQVPKFPVEGMCYRSLLGLIKSALSEPAAASHFHLFPFEEYVQSPSGPQRVYTELYNSQVFIDEHLRVKEATLRRGITTETVVIGCLFWSDSTHLTSFGNASLWPIYTFFANQSKYSRAKPSSFSAHHLAYIPSLTKQFEELYTDVFGEPPSKSTIPQARRELVHVIWIIILDDNFVHAYVYGFEWTYWDSIIRLSFPRVFGHGMDYPEKILLACVKQLGRCPCPMCLIRRSRIPLLGTVQDDRVRERQKRQDTHAHQYDIDSVRKKVYLKGASLDSKSVKEILGVKSITPIRSAFSVKLGPHGFDYFSVILPDEMHEFELGVWKAVFTHLVRILFALDPDTVIEMNWRYRHVPTFGRDIIRLFSLKMSDMAHLAARDWEDLLQCALAVFDKLLPDRNDDAIVMALLFELSTWHALAKLRSHQPATILELQASTKRLGACLRKFVSEVCEKYDTRPLEKEIARKGRRKAAADAKKKSDTKGKARAQPTLDEAEPEGEGSKKTQFNLLTYKIHALGHYAEKIPLYGPTDNYSTQTGELEHRRVKKFYPTAYRRDYTIGIAKQQRRERILYLMRGGLHSEPKKKKSQKERLALPFNLQEKLPAASPDLQYQMSHQTAKACQLNILKWMNSNKGDPALQGFLTKLKTHAYFRLKGMEWDGDESAVPDSELRKVVIINDTLYRHKTLRINSTTYDLQRMQDSINTRGRADVLVQARDQGRINEYWFARIIGIFHVRVVYHGGDDFEAQPQDMDFCYIRWFGKSTENLMTPTKPKSPTGFATRTLHAVGFVNESVDASPAFGFLDPRHIIRAVHLIPVFDRGKSDNGIPGDTIARLESDEGEDWNYFYVNMFVDRDMFMRFRGGGIGHQSTRQATDAFLNDRHPSDLQRRADPRLQPQESEHEADLHKFAEVHNKNNPKMGINVAADNGSPEDEPESGNEDSDDEDWESDDWEDDVEEMRGIDDDENGLGAEDGEDDADELEILRGAAY